MILSHWQILSALPLSNWILVPTTHPSCSTAEFSALSTSNQRTGVPIQPPYSLFLPVTVQQITKRISLKMECLPNITSRARNGSLCCIEQIYQLHIFTENDIHYTVFNFDLSALRPCSWFTENIDFLNGYTIFLLSWNGKWKLLMWLLI